MHHDFENIKQAFKDAGIDSKKTEFSITNYSLNTKLSFKFANISELLFFLNLNASANKERVNEINAMIVDAGLDPESFFYVNFFKPRVAEL